MFHAAFVVCLCLVLHLSKHVVSHHTAVFLARLPLTPPHDEDPSQLILPPSPWPGSGIPFAFLLLLYFEEKCAVDMR